MKITLMIQNKKHFKTLIKFRNYLKLTKMITALWANAKYTFKKKLIYKYRISTVFKIKPFSFCIKVLFS